MRKKKTPSIGEVVKITRKMRHLTQEELAEKAGISVNTIRNLEANRSGVSFDILSDIAKSLGLQTSELVGGTE